MKPLIPIILLLAISAKAQDLITCSAIVCTSPLPLSVPSLMLTGGTTPSGSLSNLYLWQYTPTTGTLTLFPFTPPAIPTTFVVTIPAIPVYGTFKTVTVQAAGAVPGSTTVAATPCTIQANVQESPQILLSCWVSAPGVVTVYALNNRSKDVASFPATLVVY
jgi:hypothetical protein